MKKSSKKKRVVKKSLTSKEWLDKVENLKAQLEAETEYLAQLRYDLFSNFESNFGTAALFEDALTSSREDADNAKWQVKSSAEWLKHEKLTKQSKMQIRLTEAELASSKDSFKRSKQIVKLLEKLVELTKEPK